MAGLGVASLASLLELRGDELVELWVSRVRALVDERGRTHVELRDHMPLVMKELVQTLQRGYRPVPAKDASGATKDAPSEHGRQRFRIGFDVEQVIEEYALLHTIILDATAAAEVMLSMNDTRLLLDFFSRAVAEGVQEHERAAKRTQVAMEAELRLVMNALPVLVAFVDKDERYGLANQCYEEWFGIPAETLRGQKVRDVIGEQAYAKLGPYVARGLAGERFSFEEHGVPYRLGGIRDVHVSFCPQLDADGAPDGYVVMLDDITARRALQRERDALAQQRAEDLQSLADALRRQSEFEQQLLGIASHDLRNPLNVIVMASSLLAQGRDPDDADLKHVTRIQNAAQRATNMIRDLLDFTQARFGGGIRVEPRLIALEALVRPVVDEVAAAHPTREVVYHHGAGRDEARADPERLGQVIQNLVSNAIKYSPPGTPVDVATEVTDRDATLRVHNFGTPIPETQLAAIFEPFDRGGKVDQASRSIGLGLYIVREIVRAHRGRVSVTSTASEGTAFTVTLPLSDA